MPEISQPLAHRDTTAKWFLISSIAYFFIDDWLLKFQYHTVINWWVFALSGVGALVITLLTVSYQSIKAAVANPVKSLRTE